MKNGVATAKIVAGPMPGKSALLNAPFNEERAIVSAIPGTTRDTIEETMNINGLELGVLSIPPASDIPRMKLKKNRH